MLAAQWYSPQLKCNEGKQKIQISKVKSFVFTKIMNEFSEEQITIHVYFSYNAEEVPLTLAKKKKNNHDKLEVSKCYQRALTIATKKYDDLYKLCRDGIIPNSYHLEYFSMNTSEEKADCLDETDTEESSTSSDDE